MFTTNAISMLLAFITLFTATIAIPTSTSLDTVKRCNALIETVPWQLVNIQLFNATVPGNSTSSINFHFCDTSPGLEIETECGYIFPSGQNATPAYQPCVNQTIGFTYSDGLIQVAREYQDHCLGEYPYDQGEFFGHGNTDFQSTTANGGELSTQTMLEVPVTSQD